MWKHKTRKKKRGKTGENKDKPIFVWAVGSPFSAAFNHHSSALE